MKKGIKTALTILLLLLLIAAAGTLAYTGERVYIGSVNLTDNEQTALDRERQLLACGIDPYVFSMTYNIEQIYIASSLDSHKIPADFISIDGEKNRDTAILVHGLGGNRLSNYAVAELFLRHGWNVITYDQRASGENLAKYNTFGYLESNDAINYVNYADKLVDSDKRIALWGTSFGGATVGVAMANDYVNSRVSAAVMDCPVSSMRDMVSFELEGISESTGMPAELMLWAGGIALKLHMGFSLEDVEITDYVNRSQIPLLVINSKADETTPFYMGQEIFFASGADKKDIFTSPDSAHAHIFFDNPRQYERKMFGFIDSIPAPTGEGETDETENAGEPAAA